MHNKLAPVLACSAILSVVCSAGYAQAFSCPGDSPTQASRESEWIEAHSIGTVAKHVHDSLTKLGYRFPNPVETFGTYTSEPKWKWPTVMAFDGWRQLTYPGAIVTITLEPVDVWTKIRIETRLLCDTKQTPPAGAIAPDFESYVLQRTDFEVTSAIRSPLYRMPIDVLGSSCSPFNPGDPKIKVCEAIAKNSPESPRAQFEYALSLIEFYHAERAWKPLERYFELAGEDRAAYQFAGLQMLATSSYDEAKRLFERALRLWPDDPVLHYGLGRAEAGRGREKQALESFRRAIELDSSFAEAFYYAAAAHEARDEMEDARRYCEGASHQLELELAARQGEVEVWLMLARCFATTGEHQRAVASFYRAYEVDRQVTASDQAVITAVTKSFEVVGEQAAAPLPGPVVAKARPSRLPHSFEPRGAMAPATSRVPGEMDLVPPGEIDQFTLVARDTVANTPHYKYEGPNIIGLDVFIWEVTDTSTTAVKQALEQQVTDYQQTLPIGVERGWYDAYELVFAEPKPLTVLDGIVSGHVVAVALRQADEVNLTFFYIHALRGHFVKVRLTIPGHEWSENDALDFPEAVIRRLANKR